MNAAMLKPVAEAIIVAECLRRFRWVPDDAELAAMVPACLPIAKAAIKASPLLAAAKAALIQAEGCFLNHYPGDDPANAAEPEHIAMLRAAIECTEE